MRWAWSLPPDLRAPFHARRLLEQSLTAGVAPRALEDARLLVSELVTNAVQHGLGSEPLNIQVTCEDGVIRVSVSEPAGHWGSPGEPTFRASTAAPDDERGRGLGIVEHVALRWGVRSEAGTEVWFEVPSGDGAVPQARDESSIA